MADWRAIDTNITDSWDVAQLSTVGKILFTWGIVKSDKWGILVDDTGAIKLRIMAGVKCTRQQIEKQLTLMETQDMIWRYRSDGCPALIQFRNFDEYQPRELIRTRGYPKYPVHPDWKPRDDIEGQKIPEKSRVLQNIPEAYTQKRTDKNRGEEKRQEQTEALADDDAQFDRMTELDAIERLKGLGISSSVSADLAQLSQVTEDYLETWRLWLVEGKGKGFKNVQGYLVKHIRAGDWP